MHADDEFSGATPEVSTSLASLMHVGLRRLAAARMRGTKDSDLVRGNRFSHAGSGSAHIAARWDKP